MIISGRSERGNNNNDNNNNYISYICTGENTFHYKRVIDKVHLKSNILINEDVFTGWLHEGH